MLRGTKVGRSPLPLQVATTALLLVGVAAIAMAAPRPLVGPDNNSADNPFVQPQDPALSGGDRDQSQQFGDLMIGSPKSDLLIGRLGSDTVFGRNGADIIIGGPEHSNPFNQDRLFGDDGVDIFIWSPGDGNDLFDGGRGTDVLIVGLLGEIDNGKTVFRVSDDQQAGEVAIKQKGKLPRVDVTNSPGFCPVIEGTPTSDTGQELAALGLDHLVQFVMRDVRDSFESDEQSDDNGLRATLHLRSVELLICASRAGGTIEILDLTTSPPSVTTTDGVTRQGRLRNRLRQMLL